MRRARDLAGRGAGLVALDAMVVLVVPVPVLLAPVVVVGERLHGVGNAPVLGRELLAELGRAGRADLDAAPARDALGLVDVGNVGRAAQVRRVEQLRSAQRVADVDLAVADGEDLVLAVDIGDLVHEAVLLGGDEGLDDLVIGDEVALARLDEVVGHVAHADAPFLRVVRAALAAGALAQAAGAGACGVAVVLLEPM